MTTTQYVKAADRLADDRGSISPLILVYVLIALAAGLVIASAADLYLARKQLFSVADAAALAAVARYELDAVTVVNGDAHVVVDPDQARRAADDYLLAHGPAGAHVTAMRVDGDRVELTVAGTWSPSFGTSFVPLSVPIEVEVSARGDLE